MHILCVKHKEGDFVLTFECTKFQKRWDKGCHLLSENTSGYKNITAPINT